MIHKEYVELILPDGKSLIGHVSSVTPVVDSASQTQNIILTVNDKSLPINLIAKVKIEKKGQRDEINGGRRINHMRVNYKEVVKKRKR